MRWLYGTLIVLAALIGIAAFYPDSAPLVRRQIRLLTGYSQRKTLLPDPSVSRSRMITGVVTIVIIAIGIVRIRARTILTISGNACAKLLSSIQTMRRFNSLIKWLRQRKGLL
jgi:hypothetical protein